MRSRSESAKNRGAGSRVGLPAPQELISSDYLQSLQSLTTFPISLAQSASEPTWLHLPLMQQFTFPGSLSPALAPAGVSPAAIASGTEKTKAARVSNTNNFFI